MLGAPTLTKNSRVGAGGEEVERASPGSSHSSRASGKSWLLPSPVWKVEENAEFNREELMPKGAESQAELPKAGKLMLGVTYLIWLESGVMEWPEDPGQPGQPRGLLGPPGLSGVFPKAAGCPAHPTRRPVEVITSSWACFISEDVHQDSCQSISPFFP